MSAISRVDQAVVQLRAQLQRLARERAERRGQAGPSEARPLDRLRQAGPPPDLGEREFRRKFVRALLTEELGDELGNHPEFERISNEVWQLLDEEPATSKMLDEALRALVR